MKRNIAAYFELALENPDTRTCYFGLGANSVQVFDPVMPIAVQLRTPSSGTVQSAQRIVIIDDDPRDLQYMASMADICSGMPIAVDCFSCVQQALSHLTETNPGLVLLDDHLSGGERAEGSLQMMRQAGYAGPVAIISGVTTPGRREGLVRAGVISFVDKDDLDSAGLKLLLEMAAARDGMFTFKGHSGAKAA